MSTASDAEGYAPPPVAASSTPGRYTDDEWRELAVRYFDRWESDRAAARDYVSAQSRWMVAQLFVANSGALAALATAEPLRASFTSAGPWFVAGLVLAMGCGLATWVGGGWIAEAYGRMADPALVIDRTKWPEPDPQADRRMTWAHRLAIAAGALSLGAFTLGACAVRVV